MRNPDPHALRDAVETYLDAVVDDAIANVRTGHGGPFAAVVIPAGGGAAVSRATNGVTRDPDPTAHAEVAAIRAAARTLGTPRLEGHVLLASCEPCPMCVAACLWSRLDGVAWLADRHDAAGAGFDDDAFYRALRAPDPLPSSLAGMRLLRIEHPRAREPFAAWEAFAERVPY
jgi:guanine deaminase